MAKDKVTETELVKAPTQAMEVARPSFIEEGNTGMEHLTKDDMQMPRLSLAQLTSPELDPENLQRFVEGLMFGNMFNNLTKMVYGNGPLKFCILRADPPRYMEFVPLDEGGGVKDPDVKAGDPRTLFRTGPDGKSLPPIATKFYDYVIMLMPSKEVISWSLKSTGLKTAKQLNALANFRNAPQFSGLYELSTSTTKNSKGRFAIFNVANAGWLPDQETYDLAKKMSETLSNRKIVFDTEAEHAIADGGDADESFEYGANARTE